MVRSFSLSSKQQNSIWRGKEHANLQYKKTETILVEGTGLTVFSDLSLSTLYDKPNLSLSTFCHLKKKSRFFTIKTQKKKNKT